MESDTHQILSVPPIGIAKLSLINYGYKGYGAVIQMKRIKCVDSSNYMYTGKYSALRLEARETRSVFG